MLIETETGSVSAARSRLSVRKAVGWLHLWLGLISGSVVFILSVTGCIYVFEKEIKSWVYADRLEVKPGPGAPMPLPILWEKAQSALGPGMPIRSVHIPGGADRSYAFSAFKSDPEALTYFGSHVYYRHVYVNPYDGMVIKVQNTKYEFFNLVLWIHWSLLLSTKVGQPIVGVAVLIFVVLLLTGMVLWWPRSRAALKARLKVAWRARWKRLNWDLHAVGGFYVMAIALVIALTGLVWAFKWFNKSVYFLATAGGSPVKEQPLVSDTTAMTGAAPLEAILARAVAEAPAFRELYINLPDNASGTASAFARLGGKADFQSISLRFDQHTGALLRKRAFSDQNRGEKLRSLNYDLHVGSILGMPGKILAFLASLICATLPVSGLLIWLGKRRRARLPPSLSQPTLEMHS